MTNHEHAFNDSTLNELIVSVPHLLGFFPNDSLVLVPYRSVGPDKRALAIRENLADLEGGRVRVGSFGKTLSLQDWDKAVLFVIGGGRPGEAGEPPYRWLVDRITLALRGNSVEVCCAVWVAEIRENAQWVVYTEPPRRTGQLPDPRFCGAAVQATSLGLVTHDSRQGLLDTLTPDSDDALRRRRWQLSLLERHQDAEADEDVERLRRRVLRIHDAVKAVEKGEPPVDDRQLVLLGRALLDPLVWNGSLRYLFNKRFLGAHQLWLHLTRCLPDWYRADAAVLLSLSAAMMGRTELAGLAANIAACADPGRIQIREFAGHLRHGVLPTKAVHQVEFNASLACQQLAKLFGDSLT